jgi:hypothetical protein
MADMIESSALMGALLSIIHLEMFHMAMQAFSCLAANSKFCKEGTEVLEILSSWFSPFSGYSLISNQITLGHQDTLAQPEGYNLLGMFRDYTNGVLEFSGLCITLDYPHGSLVTLCRKIIQHAVPAINGNQVCIAYYMRTNAHEQLQVPPVRWMTLDSYS